jgi:hypothetical protein
MAYTNIDFPAEYFNTVLYTGDDATNRSITGVGFQPDFTWIKSRSNAFFHELYDVVRGFSSTTNGRVLYSNATSAEGTPNTFNSFNTDGFTVSKQSGETGTNGNGATFVAWNWLANGAGVSNTAGTISSTVSANTTAGFSIVSYAGNSTNDATIGHGLGVAPSMVIIKNRTSALSGSAGAHWITRHIGISMTTFGAACQVALSLTDGAITNSHGTLITNGSTLLQIKEGGSSPTYFHVGETGNNYIAYCFADVKGFSKFGKYTGSGDANGPFVYTGFKPAFIITKRTDNTSQWQLLDNKRLGFNPSNSELYADSSEVENTVTKLDILSNGFKLRTTSTTQNASGGTYIYAAFAENPFVTSGGIPTTAR